MTDAIEMMVGHEDGKVVVIFKDPVARIEFEPQNCIDVARCMTDHAFEARDGVKPVGDTLKAELVERHRMTLTQRLSLMLSTMRRDNMVTDGVMAQRMVEACLKEIF